jgi:hypothetical protein
VPDRQELVANAVVDDVDVLGEVGVAADRKALADRRAGVVEPLALDRGPELGTAVDLLDHAEGAGPPAATDGSTDSTPSGSEVMSRCSPTGSASAGEARTSRTTATRPLSRRTIAPPPEDDNGTPRA